MTRSTPEWIAKHDDEKIPPRVRLRVFERRLLTKAIPEPNSGCWLWMGAATKRGYGHMLVDGSFEKAHRLSYRLFNGPIPVEMHVCHRCDNPYCINPEHLFVGTAKQNIADCIRKGRARRGNCFGDKNKSTKLTSEQVREIRSAPPIYGSATAFAKRFGVRAATIRDIRNRKSRVSE